MIRTDGVEGVEGLEGSTTGVTGVTGLTGAGVTHSFPFQTSPVLQVMQVTPLK